MIESRRITQRPQAQNFYRRVYMSISKLLTTHTLALTAMFSAACAAELSPADEVGLVVGAAGGVGGCSQLIVENATADCVPLEPVKQYFIRSIGWTVRNPNAVDCPGIQTFGRITLFSDVPEQEHLVRTNYDSQPINASLPAGAAQSFFRSVQSRHSYCTRNSLRQTCSERDRERRACRVVQLELALRLSPEPARSAQHGAALLTLALSPLRAAGA